MEESKGLKEHPKLLKNNGQGYSNGMGARRISKACLENSNIPDEIITVDTTPLFKGEPGIALYSNHWELTDLEASEDLINKTKATVQRVKSIEPKIKLANNTNDYLHYGYEFNKDLDKSVVSVALEPAIFPYHQKGERVFKNDISRVMNILVRYLDEVGL
jgi:phage-related protein